MAEKTVEDKQLCPFDYGPTLESPLTQLWVIGWIGEKSACRSPNLARNLQALILPIRHFFFYVI